MWRNTDSSRRFNWEKAVIDMGDYWLILVILILLTVYVALIVFENKWS